MNIKLFAIAASALAISAAASQAQAGAKDYEFQPVIAEVKNGRGMPSLQAKLRSLGLRLPQQSDIGHPCFGVIRVTYIRAGRHQGAKLPRSFQ
jgi:hypothetical protein